MIVSKNPRYLSGAPNINSSRLSVYNVLAFLRDNSYPINLFMLDYNLSSSDVKEILRYCSQLDCIDEKPMCSFCQNCILNEFESTTDLKNLKIKIRLFQENSEVYLKQQKKEDDLNLEKECGWEIAKELYEKLFSVLR
ncbi:MAG: DUF433 domain-containing protein [Thermoflexibacter sp.]|jgi:uncharacterized protein (DUF433 family)|nr:DUF433 domain-containing protein [Thermoflexibacter sp.]